MTHTALSVILEKQDVETHVTPKAEWETFSGAKYTNLRKEVKVGLRLRPRRRGWDLALWPQLVKAPSW